MIAVMLASALLVLCGMAIGFYLGSFTEGSLGSKIVGNIKRQADKQKVGGVQKLTASELTNRGTILEETEKEMEKLFDKEIGGDTNASQNGKATKKRS